MINEDFYGDQFKWFIGVVKDSFGDKNRVRVRIFGVHRADDITDVSDGDLQPALVLYPTTGGHTSGGSMSHGLVNGTWVFGFFADGDDCQQPVILGVIDGGAGSASTSIPRNGAESPGSPGDSGTGSSTTDSPGTTSTSVNLPGNSNVEKAYNMIRDLIEKSGQSGGDVHAQACGILGNIIAESQCNPNAGFSKAAIDTDGGKTYGICSWNTNSGRPQKMFREYGDHPTLDQQISFMWGELMTCENKAFKRIMAARNVMEATQAMCFYERPACYKRTYIDTNNKTFPPRIEAAQKLYSSIKYTPIDKRTN